MTVSMTCEQLETILPELLDDETAGPAMTTVVRGHLDACARCRALLDDLSAIRTAAGRLPPLTPPRDLWNGIASRIETPIFPLVDGIRVRPPRRQMSLRSAGIAAALIVAANVAISYQLIRRDSAAVPEVTPSLAAADTAMIPAPSLIPRSGVAQPMMVPLPVPMTPVASSRPTFVLATNEPPDDQEAQQPSRRREAAKIVYDREISRLRAIVDSGRHKLDPATVAILDRNLRIIDLAIEQCNDALVRDSSSSFLLESLNNAYQTKVKLLRIAATAASRG